MHKLALVGFLAFALPAISHLLDQPAIEIENEPHHTLVLENPQARVFRLVLQPGESTRFHRHTHPYAFLSFVDMKMLNIVPGRTPVTTELSAGELHTSKGGFSLVEQNAALTPSNLIVVERMGQKAAPFGSPMIGFKYHDAAVGELFEMPAMRGYVTRLASGGRTEPHEEKFDRLIVAVTNLHLGHQFDERNQTETSLKAGDVRWIAKASDRSIVNLAGTACSFITIEFN